MKNALADIYSQMLLNEKTEKSELQNPSNDDVGNLSMNQGIFGKPPKAVEGPEKAKLQQGPSYKETTGSAHAKATSSNSGSFKGSAPAKETKTEAPKEMKKDTDVDPSSEKEETEETEETPKKKEKTHNESFGLSSFETLFKKTLQEELEEEPLAPEADSSMEIEDELPEEEHEGAEEELEEEEGDLVSDLHELRDRLDSILAKLEDVASEEEELESGEMEDEEYSDDDFDTEFGDEEEPVKESMEKPKVLNSSKGKCLMNKKNKVGRLSAKGGKANSGSLKHEPKPKALGDKKSALQKGTPVVRSSIQKGDFIK